MSVLLAIDYGEKRCGIATSDPLQIIAQGLMTIPTEKLLSFLVDFCQKENVSTFVIGYPNRLSNQPSEVEAKILQFIEQLQKKLPYIPIERIDERFTSKIAFRTMIDGGLKKQQRKNKALIDQISATILLQDYMETMKNSRSIL